MTALMWLCLCCMVTAVVSLDPYTVIQKSSPVMDAVKGSTVEIRCDVNNRPDGISTRWERESNNCTSGQTCRTVIAQDRLPNDQQKYGIKFQASDTYYLIIKNVDEKDESHYYCQLPLTLYVKVYDTIFLRVVEPPSIDPLKTSSDKSVSIGDDVVLTCGAYGRPKPLIKWTRSGNGMLPGGGYVKLSETLVIPKIQADYRGPYICTAQNDIGQEHRTINIQMNFPPQVSGSPNTATQKIGYETRLFCHVSSRPQAAITWSINGKTVETGDMYKVTEYESAFNKIISKLTVYSVSSTEVNGDIKCVASNDLGTSDSAFTIEASAEVMPIPGASSSSSIIYITTSILCSAMLFSMATLLL